MIFDIEQIETFRLCPLQYKFKYVDKIPASEESSSTQFSKSLHKVIYYFFNSIMNGMPVSDSKLAKKWQEEWFNGVDVQDVLFGTKREKTDIGYKGLGMLHTLYNNEHLNPGFVIGVNMHMDRVPIGDYFINTDIELIREVQEGNDKLIEIVDFRAGYNYPDEWMALNDLRLTMQSYAFRKIFGAKEQRSTYYFLRTNKKIYTHRNAQQFDRLKTTIDSVAQNINAECFYPREGHHCKTCPFRDICSVWPVKQDNTSK